MSVPPFRTPVEGEAVCREVLEFAKEKIPANACVTVFVFGALPDGGGFTSYVSNGGRKEVSAALLEWVEHQAAAERKKA